MRFIVFLFLRLLVVGLAYFFTTLFAAGFVTFVLFLGSDTSWLIDDPVVAGSALLFFAALWWYILQVALAPFSLILLAMELGKFQSLTLNCVAGGACAVAILLLGDVSGIMIETELPYTENEVWSAALAGGLVSGITYWLLAGRRAGKWLGEPRH